MPSKNLNVAHNVVEGLDTLRNAHGWSYSQAIEFLLKIHETMGLHPEKGAQSMTMRFDMLNDEGMRALSLSTGDLGRMVFNTEREKWFGWNGKRWMELMLHPAQEPQDEGGETQSCPDCNPPVKPPIVQVKRAEFMNRMRGYVLEASSGGASRGYEYDDIYAYIRGKYGHMVTKKMVADTVEQLIKERDMVKVGHKYGNRIRVRANSG